MGVQSTGMKAYENAVQHFNAVESSLRQGMPVQYSRGTDRSLLRDSVDRSEDFGSHSDFMVRREARHTAFGQDNSFSQTLSESLARGIRPPARLLCGIAGLGRALPLCLGSQPECRPEKRGHHPLRYHTGSHCAIR